MLKKYLLKMLQVFNALALMVVIQSVNSTCTFYYHQPEAPEGLEKFRMD